tara:strand:- start:168 stop:422 length:255 start_codon:yes stop_codon:yes gene_type:complete
MNRYKSAGYKDHCAGVGLRVLRYLDLQDDEDVSPRDVEKIISDRTVGLKVIATWAACDDHDRESRTEAMEAIRKHALKSLGRSG